MCVRLVAFFAFLFREHTKSANILGFSFICNIFSRKVQPTSQKPILEKHFPLSFPFFLSLFLCSFDSFHFVSLILVCFVQFLVNFYVICGILIRQSFAGLLFFIRFVSFSSLCFRFASCRHKFNSIYTSASVCL